MKKNYFKSLMQAAVLLCAPLIISSCDELATEDNTIGSYISMATSDVTITLHKDYDPTFTRTAIAASTAVINYYSEDEKVATVDAVTGKVTGVGEGKTNIVAKATGYNTSGKKIYTVEEVKYPVTVIDKRVQIKFEKTEASVNSADIRDAVFKFEKSSFYPATATVTYTHTPATGSTDPIANIDTDTGVITLNSDNGKAVITAEIDPSDAGIPAGWDKETFLDGGKFKATFTLEVKEGIAYMAWDADKGETVRKTMLLKDDAGKDQYTKIDAAPTADLTLKAGIYYFGASFDFTKNIKIEGDVDFILKDGVIINQTGNIQDATSDGHVINVYGQKAQSGKLKVAATGNAILDFKTINIYGGELYTTSSNASSGAINKISAINVYNGLLVAEKITNIGYGIKMNTDSKITVAGGILVAKAEGTDGDHSWGVIGNVVVNKGTFYALSGYKAVDGTLTAGTGYKFQECDDLTITATNPPAFNGGTWADITGTKSEKKYVKSVKK